MNKLTQNISKTICLNMIVKNESKIITRLFDSIINIIDTYCICDTGSTDNTIQIIEAYFKNKSITNKSITGKIIEKEFRNFGYNRNYAYLFAILGICFAILGISMPNIIFKYY